jgi:arsenite-transporting ATPase
MERAIARFARPVAKRFYDVPLPGEDYFNAVEYLFQRLQGVEEILADPTVTTVRLVTNPEKIVLKETQRAFMYFSLYKMTTDAIIINRILPENVKDAYFDDWRHRQAEYVRQAEEYFSPIPIFPVNLFRGEILGGESLSLLADQIYGDRDPLERFFEGEPYSLDKIDGKYRMIIRLPFLQKSDIDLNKVADELIIRVGSFKRHVLLPRQVAASKSVNARLDGADLLIQFEP